MTSVTVFVWLRAPLVPLMVNVEVPLAALFCAVIRRVDVPEPEMLVGVNVAVVRFGNPVTLKLTVPLKPETAPIVTV